MTADNEGDAPPPAAPKPEVSPEELKITAAFQAADFSEAATVALRVYGPGILKYVTGIVRDDNAGQEVFSHFCEDLWKGIETFRAESSFRAWAYRLAWHASQRYYRDPFGKRARRLQTAAHSSIEQEVRAATAPYLRTVVKNEFQRLLAELEPDERTLLTLRLDHRLSWREISSVMTEQGEAMGEPALRKRFERTKQKLQKLAAKAGILPPRE